jgi:hypothetical protein
MGDVDLETFMRGNGRCEGVDETGEGWNSSVAKLAACVS